MTLESFSKLPDNLQHEYIIEWGFLVGMRNEAYTKYYYFVVGNFAVELASVLENNRAVNSHRIISFEELNSIKLDFITNKSLINYVNKFAA